MEDLGFLGSDLAVLLVMQVEPGDKSLERLWEGDRQRHGRLDGDSIAPSEPSSL